MVQQDATIRRTQLHNPGLIAFGSLFVCKKFFYLLIVGVFFLAVGCDSRQPISPARIILDPYASGNNQCGLHGEPLAKPLQVVVQGSKKRGLLGGKGSYPSVKNAEVTFEIENPESGAIFDANNSTKIIAKSDTAGRASAKLKLGNRSTAVTVNASVQTNGGTKTARFNVASGVEIIGTDLEGPAGGLISEFGVRLQDAPGKPAKGVTVLFSAVDEDDGSSVADSRILSDNDGRAVTSWRLGKKGGQKRVLVEIQDHRSGVPSKQIFQVRAIKFTAVVTDKLNIAIQLFGGLAVFILGMKTMSDGLKRMADRRLKSILQAMTRNRFLAVAVGTGLTAMIQSSSATTVMMVGFVNAGLVTLYQAIGVIFGANIGTTITAQIIASRLDALAFPAIALGLIMSGLARKPAVKSLGNAIMGFGLLFLGMTTMSGVLKPLRHSPEFIALFKTFDCTPDPGGFVKPGAAFMCIMIGTVATAIIQSSSATVGLVLVLCSQGLLTFYTAIGRQHRHDYYSCACINRNKPECKAGGPGTYSIQCFPCHIYVCIAVLANMERQTDVSWIHRFHYAGRCICCKSGESATARCKLPYFGKSIQLSTLPAICRYHGKDMPENNTGHRR